MPSAGDVADFLLGGILGDVHDLFTVDVEPGDLARAAGAMMAMSDTVRTIHVQLSGSVASLEGRWEGDGAAAFDSELWQPLSHGLGVLEHECETAASSWRSWHGRPRRRTRRRSRRSIRRCRTSCGSWGRRR